MSKSIYNIRCPYCGDSSKNEFKKRGYILYKENEKKYFYYCHNCGISKDIQDFINDNKELSQKLNIETLLSGEGKSITNQSNLKSKNFYYINIKNKFNFYFSQDILKNEYINKRVKLYPGVIESIPSQIKSFRNYNGVGFVIYSKNLPFKIVIRNLLDSISYKYITLNIDNLYSDQYYKSFIVDNNDNFYLCEGIFDALSIKNGIPCFGVGNMKNIIKKMIENNIPRYKIVVITDSDLDNPNVDKIIEYCKYSTTPYLNWNNNDLHKYKDINEIPVDKRFLIKKHIIRTKLNKKT